MKLKTLLQFFVAHNNSIKDYFRIMKVSFFLLFACAFHLIATETEAQNTVISIGHNNLSIRQFIKEIESQTDYLVVFRNQDVDVNKVISFRNRTGKVSDFLDEMYKNTNIGYISNSDYITLSQRVTGTDENDKRITGKVVDEKGEPVIGANIIEKGTTNGSVTDYEGNFSLTTSGNAVLQISYIGYIPIEVPVRNQNIIQIVIREDTQSLDEVVVTALGIRREEKALGYAVQKVSGEKLSTVKAVDVGSALTGKIAGLNVSNSTEFNEAPAIYLRGEEPLLVVDGVPYQNLTLRDIASDDIASIDVLKGATASALYGSRGGSGAVMVTTKRGQEEGLHVQINSSTMFNAGFLKLPKNQTSYSSGINGVFDPSDSVWGDKMDIGRTAVQYDPYTYEWKEMPLVSKGKNNFKNFLEFSFVTNNNVNITQKGKYGSFRTSLTHVYNKGQYPNTKLNKLTYTVAGDMSFGDFNFEGGITYNKRFYPNNFGTGYGRGGFIYNLLVWTGADVDIREYKNYWRVKDKEANWRDEVWYDNPYFIANEITHSSDLDMLNGFFNTGYTITPWLKASLRTGIDVYGEREKWRNPVSARGGWDKKGYYEEKQNRGFSTNTDFIITADHTFGEFTIDGFAGASLFFYQDDWTGAATRNGLSIPGYYSIYASVDAANVYSKLEKKQVNSLYGKASVAWKSTLFLDVTARNDWSSTLPSETRSYFYPSVSGSFVASEVIPMPEWISFWKLRSSWTQTKQDLGIFDTNNTYTIKTNQWDGLNGATYPTSIKDPFIRPSATRTYEIGTTLNFLQNRVRLDLTYYDKLYYNMTYDAPISETSGFEKSLINIDEEHVRRGFEITLGADVVKNKDFSWTTILNWSADRLTFAKIDPVYSSQRPWVKKGSRVDYYDYYDWERDSNGNIIHEGGYPIQNKYYSKAGNRNSDWTFGFNNVFKYKNITLGISIDGRIGGVTHSVTNQGLWISGAHPDSDNQWRYDEVVDGRKNYVGQGVMVVSGSVEKDVNGNIIRDDRVFAPNDKQVSYEGYMKLYHGTGNVWDPKQQHILDQTFIKLRELSVTYDLPASLCSKLKLNTASVSLIGNNVFLWAKDFKYSDPDKSFDKGNNRQNDNLNSPSLRMLGCNLKINF